MENLFENFKSLAKEKPLTIEEQKELVKSKNLTSEIEQKILASNFKMIVNRYNKYEGLTNEDFSKEDLYEVVTSSFIKALRLWEPDKGALSTVYYVFVKKDILNALKKGKAIKRIPGSKLVSHINLEINGVNEETDILETIEDESANFEKRLVENMALQELKSYFPLILSDKEIEVLNNETQFIKKSPEELELSQRKYSATKLKAAKKVKALYLYLSDNENYHEVLRNIDPKGRELVKKVINLIENKQIKTENKTK